MISSRAAIGFLTLLSLSAGGCASAPEPLDGEPADGIEEASGVMKFGNELLIVGDHEPGTYYRLRLADPEDFRVRLEPDRLTRHRIAAGTYARDLESINVLADGRIVILSERSFSLFDANGIVATYDHSLAEFGGRGLEGLAVRSAGGGRSLVAVSWEGGYPDPDRLPAPIASMVCQNALRPVVVVHELARNERDAEIDEDRSRQIELEVPLPVGNEPFAQRFRAPDLVWHRWREDGREVWGFIVLLSSEWGEKPGPGSPEHCPETKDGKPLKYCYKWLQRFTEQGKPVGKPFDLRRALPEPLRDENWEGMGWWEPGRSLVFVYDEKLRRKAIDPQEAFVLPLPEGW